MSALAIESIGFDPLRDKSYRLTRLGGPIVDYLASKEQLGRAGTTLDDKERYLASFAKMWPAVTLEEVETRHCVHWLAAQPRGETGRVRRSHLNDFFKWAIRWDLIVRNPLDRLEQPPRAKKRVYDVFSDAEIAALTSLPALDGTLMLIMFDTGLRNSECRSLQARNIIPAESYDPDEEPRVELAVLGGKGDKDRLVTSTRRLARALAEYQLVEGMNPKDFFWYTKPGGKLRRSVRMGEGSFQLWYRRALSEAGVRYRNPHMTRHSFATRWLRRGGRLETLSMVMGHESIRTTFDLYSHLDTRDVRLDLEVIEGSVRV